MNILWILDKEFDVALNVSARLATMEYLEKQHNLTLVTSFRKERKEFPHVQSQIIYLKTVAVPFLKLSWLYYQQLKLIKKRLDLRRYDLVYINSGNFILMRGLVRRRRDHKPVLVLDVRTLPTESNPLRKWFGYLMLRKSLQIAAGHFDGVSYITETMQRYCENRFRLPRHTYVIWGTGVDLDRFKLAPPANPNSAKLRIMYHGKVTDNRGIANVVRAMSRLKDIDVEFLMLGNEHEFDKLKRIVRNCGLNDKVSFVRHVPYDCVPDYINRADAGILPFPGLNQWNTSSAIKLFEYLACGRPVIVTKIPAHVEVLDRKAFAFWADTSSPDDLARAMRAAFYQKPNFGKLGEEARHFVEDNFGWESQLTKLDEFFKSL